MNNIGQTSDQAIESRILIVENDILIGAELSASVEKLGYTVCGVATSGEMAIEQTENQRPDLVLMDIVLKGEMDGVEVADRLHTSLGIPVVFIITWAEEERLKTVTPTIPFRFILKPIQDRDLKLTIEMALYVGKVDAKRRRAEKALQESEEKHRRLFETMAQGVVYQAADSKIISANPAAERILGLTLDQMLGKTSTDPGWKTIREDGSELPGEDHPAIVALRTGKPVDRMVLGVFNPRKQRHSWISVTAIPLFPPGETRPFQVYTTFDDITEERKARKEYETLFREMLEGFALHEIVCDTQGVPVDYRFLAINPAFSRMTGLKAQDVVGKTVLEVLPGTEHHWIETYGHVALTGEPAFFENYAAGLDKYFEVTAFRPTPGQFACIFSDITKRKRDEAEKDNLHVQLVHALKMEAVGTLAGGVAHDFNNLLQVINGYAQIMLLNKKKENPDCQNLNAILKAGEKAARLVRQLLLFSRKAETEKIPLDLNHELDQARKMLERTIPKMIDIELHPGSRLWAIKADPLQIEQILLNLGTNAADAMPEGGKLFIETKNISLNHEYSPNSFGAAPGNYVLLTVSDTGQGMDQQILEHIFDPFFTTKEIGKGTGLGLASVYGIVKGH
ncbi:MAG: PAS domain S-box protein, partial [Deltaproteobacteria bacterium]|nr:PAS domain S-box protein [Deltaproteobacteria bacterium]